VGADFAVSLALDKDASFRVGMVVHELAENLVKYAAEDEGALEICLELAEGGAVGCSITAENRASREQLAEVTRLLEELGATQTPDAVYQKLMSENAFKPMSGLGLARIRVEGGFHLEAVIDGAVLILRASAIWTRPAS
jgi:two-component sensor histidine kinase